MFLKRTLQGKNIFLSCSSEEIYFRVVHSFYNSFKNTSAYEKCYETFEYSVFHQYILGFIMYNRHLNII